MPSPGNLLANPGFDTSLSGWGQAGISLAPDSEGCSGSHSAYAADTSGDPLQTFPINAGALYYIGGRFKGGSSLDFFSVYFYPDVNCSTAPIDQWDFDLNGTADWAPVTGSFFTPQGVKCAQLTDSLEGVYFDQLYINASYQQF
jgi:hypothetical protein